MKEQKEACLICGAELEYFTEAREQNCAICGDRKVTNACCKNGHFVCDACHMEQGIKELLQYGLEETSGNPIEIIQKWMGQEQIHMHGPEHHVLVGAALLIAYAGSGGKIDREQALREMQERGRSVPGGICGFWGCCGSAVSSGIFLSLITETTPFSRKTWGLSNQMTSRALIRIGKTGGPRCCKRSAFLVIKEAAAFTEEHLGVKMQMPDRIVCGFSERNSECLGTSCPFFKGNEA